MEIPIYTPPINTLSAEEMALSGAELIAAERTRQKAKWTPEHDDTHEACELSVAATLLILEGSDYELVDYGERVTDRWGLVEKHKSDELRRLIIAGALIAAEIDRVKRLG